MLTAAVSTASVTSPASGTARELSSRGLQGDGDQWIRDIFTGTLISLGRISTAGASATGSHCLRAVPFTPRGDQGPPHTLGRGSGEEMSAFSLSTVIFPGL